MLVTRRWSRYHPTYRAPQMQLIAQWLANGLSCAAIGMAGCGKSNFLGFLSQTPHALAPYLGELAEKIVLIPVDLNSLPANSLDTFFRLLLRSFFEKRHQFDEETQQLISQQYLENRAATDPFLPQSGLRTLLFHFEARETRIVLVMDRFDRFAERAIVGMTDTLRSLRDSFKDTICFVVGMRQAPKYLLNPDMLGELYEILDLHVCWVGPMDFVDSQRVISEELLIQEDKLDAALVKQITQLTGGYPSLLKAVCQRYADNQMPAENWGDLLTKDENIRYRLEEIWQGLTQQEQVLLYSLSRGESCSLEELASLQMKGLLQQDGQKWHIGSSLLLGYAATAGQLSRGLIWEDKKTGMLYQGKRPLDHLPPTEAALLTFFVRHPYKKHTYGEIITAVWTDDDAAGVANEALAKQISNLRKRKVAPDRSLEPNPAKPIYIINFRAKPEGGYQFFPEGKPI